MTETFPLVCTRGVVVFPNQDIVIDVGREPSLQAVDNAQNNFENHIVLVSQKDITTDEPGLDDIYHVGTLCEVRHVRRFENFIRVKFRGLKRVRLNEWIQGNDSDMAVVDELVTYRQDETEEQALMRMIVDAYDHFTGADKFMSKDMMIELSKGVGPEGLSDKAVTALSISLDRKQAYLETLGANDRLEMLLADIEKEKKMGEVEKKINEDRKSVV